MIRADIHTHTLYSHGLSTPRALYVAALEKGLEFLGFAEHSPRPAGFDYTNEYREHLTAHLPDYAREVARLKAAPQTGKNGPCRVLFGMEMDWLDGQEDFTRAACRAFDFDYLLGSVHFIGRWGYDDNTQKTWGDFSQEECEHYYLAYFTAWEAMLRSQLFNVAAHPDLIKIYSVEQFHTWLLKPQSRAVVKHALTALRDSGMSMELSSAGLRKACREIYPAPPVMALAAELALPISFASDAHCDKDVAAGFARLASYALSFGFREYVVFEKGRGVPYPLNTL
ncbi:MAG: histidinol-phosphatase [Candidatus Desulfovibrio kirbyi]|jgi:histidinol-phosphatase (PHP family)|uniref:Histidinol-phosphatase n=1 Tax=Candidatus Desulfovibrio kirbyi TaxID=2696086 RepID=A0A6L2R751_9BACT|nr:histidinol-phosphatase [Desulfovibrio sp.]GFH63317.1 MAG: histidinol-phosphatase [Candidatus Desulfovibrio kirbyi]